MTFIHSRNVSSTVCNIPIPALLKGKTFKHEVDVIRISEFNYRQMVLTNGFVDIVDSIESCMEIG